MNSLKVKFFDGNQRIRINLQKKWCDLTIKKTRQICFTR